MNSTGKKTSFVGLTELGANCQAAISKVFSLYFIICFVLFGYEYSYFTKSSLEQSSGTDSIQSQISSKTSRGKKDTAKQDTTKYITSDSQVNSHFPYRRSPASLTLNNYFTYFLFLCLTRITKHNHTPHLKPSKNQNRRAALGGPAIKLRGAGVRLH